MNEETVFWVIHLPLMLLFLVGMGSVVAGWLKGQVGGESDSLGRKVGILIRATLSVIFSRRLLVLVKAFVTEAWFNRRLWRTNRWRWLNHFLLLSGFMLLMSLSGVAALSEKVLYKLFHLGHIPWISMWYTADHPVTGLLNEIGAVLMTVGFIFFVVRRYATRTPQLRTGPIDTWMVVGLGLILLSGWIAEIVRLNSSEVLETAPVAFIGYPLARLVSGLALPWDELTEWLYVGHGILTSVVIVTIPFSKFMHVIAGGLVAMIAQFEEETRPTGGEKGVSHVRA